MSQQPHDRTPNHADEPLTPPLGHQHPLGLHHGLGQISLQTKGLGGSSLAILDPDIFFPNGLPESDVSADVAATHQPASASLSEPANPAKPSIQPQHIKHSQESKTSTSQALQRQSSQFNPPHSRPQPDEPSQGSITIANQPLQPSPQQSSLSNHPIQPQRIEHGLNTTPDVSQTLQRQDSQPIQPSGKPQPQPQISPAHQSQTRLHSHPSIQPIVGSNARQVSTHHSDSQPSSDIIQRSNEQANQAQASPATHSLPEHVQPTSGVDGSLPTSVQAKESSDSSHPGASNKPRPAASQSAEPLQPGSSKPVSTVQLQSTHEQPKAAPTPASHPQKTDKLTHTDVQRYFNPETESSSDQHFSDRTNHTVNGAGEQVVQAKLESSSHADQLAVDDNLPAPSSTRYSEESPPAATKSAQQAPSVQRSTASSSHSSQTSSTHQPPETTGTDATGAAATTADATGYDATGAAEPASPSISKQAATSSNPSANKHSSHQTGSIIDRKVESSPTLSDPARTAESPLPTSSHSISQESTPIQRQPETSKVDVQNGSDANPDTPAIAETPNKPELNPDAPTTLGATLTSSTQDTIHRSPLEPETQIAEQQPASQSLATSEKVPETRSHLDTSIQPSSAEPEQPPPANRQERSFLQRYFSPEPSSPASNPASSNPPHLSAPDSSQPSPAQPIGEQPNHPPFAKIIAPSGSDTTINRSVEPSDISATANSTESSSSKASVPQAALQRQESSASHDVDATAMRSQNPQDISIQRQPSSDRFDRDVRSHDHSSSDSSLKPPSSADTQATSDDDRSTSPVHPAPVSDSTHLQLKFTDIAQVDSTEVAQTKSTYLQQQPTDAVQISDPGVEVKQVSLPIIPASNQTKPLSIQAKSEADSKVDSSDVSPRSASSEPSEIQSTLPSHGESQSGSVLQTNIYPVDLPAIQAQFDQASIQTIDQSDHISNQQLEPFPVTSNQVSIQRQPDLASTEQLNSKVSESVEATKSESKQKNLDSQLSTNQSVNFIQPRFNIATNQSADFIQPKADVSSNQSVEPTQPKFDADQPIKPIQKVGHAVSRLMRFFANQVNPEPIHQSNPPSNIGQAAQVEIQKSESASASNISSLKSDISETQASLPISVSDNHSNFSSIQKLPEAESNSAKSETLNKPDNNVPLEQSSTPSKTAFSIESTVPEQLSSNIISLKADSTDSLDHPASKQSTPVDNQDTFGEGENEAAIAPIAPTTASQTASNIQAKLDHTADLTTADLITIDNDQVHPTEVSESLPKRGIQASAANFTVDSSTHSAITTSAGIDPQHPTATPTHSAAETHAETQPTTSASASSSAAGIESLSATLAEPPSQPSQPASPDTLQRFEQPAVNAYTDSSISPAESGHPPSPSSGSADQLDLISSLSPASLSNQPNSDISSGSLGNTIQTKADSAQSTRDSIADQTATIEPQLAKPDTTPASQQSAIAFDAVPTSHLPEAPKAQALQRQIEETSSPTTSQVRQPKPDTTSNLDAQPTVQRTSAPEGTVANQSQAPAPVDTFAQPVNTLPNQVSQPLSAYSHEPADAQAANEPSGQAHSTTPDAHSVLPGEQSVVQRQLSTESSPELTRSTDVDTPIAEPVAAPAEPPSTQLTNQTEPSSHTATSQPSTEALTGAPASSTELLQRSTAEQSSSSSTHESSSHSPSISQSSSQSSSSASDVLASHQESTDSPTASLNALPNNASSPIPDIQTRSESETATSPEVLSDSLSEAVPSIQLSRESPPPNTANNVQSLHQPTTHLQRDIQLPNQQSGLIETFSSTTTPDSSVIPNAQPTSIQRQAEDKTDVASRNLTSASTTETSTTDRDITGAIASVSISIPASANETVQRFSDPSSAVSSDADQTISQLTNAIAPLGQSSTDQPAINSPLQNHLSGEDQSTANAPLESLENSPTRTPSIQASSVQENNDPSTTTAPQVSLASSSAGASNIQASSIKADNDTATATQVPLESLPAEASGIQASSIKADNDQSANTAPQVSPPATTSNIQASSIQTGDDQSTIHASQVSLQSASARVSNIQASGVQADDNQSANTAPQVPLESLPAGIPNIQASSTLIAEALHSVNSEHALSEISPEAPSIQASSSPTAETLHSAQLDHALSESFPGEASSAQAGRSPIVSQTQEQPLQPQTELDSAPLSSSNTNLQRDSSLEPTSISESIPDIAAESQPSAQIGAVPHSASAQTPSIQARSSSISAEQPNYLELNQPSAQLSSAPTQLAQTDSTSTDSEQSVASYLALQPPTQTPSVQAKSVQAKSIQAAPEHATPEQPNRQLQSPQPPSIQAQSAPKASNEQVDPTPITVLRPIGILRSLSTTPISITAIQAKASQRESPQQLPTAQSYNSHQHIDSTSSSSYRTQSHTEQGLAATAGFSNSHASQPTLQRQSAIADHAHDHAHHEPSIVIQPGQTSDGYTVTPEPNQGTADVQRQFIDATNQASVRQNLSADVDQAANSTVNRDRNSVMPTQSTLVQRTNTEQSESTRTTQITQASTQIQHDQSAEPNQAAEPLTEAMQPTHSQPDHIQRDQQTDSDQPAATAQSVQPFIQKQSGHIQRTEAASNQPPDVNQNAGVPTQWSSLADLVDQTQRLTAPPSSESSPGEAASVTGIQRQVESSSATDSTFTQDSATDAVLQAPGSIAPSPPASLPTQWSSLEDLVQKMPFIESAADSQEEAMNDTSQMPQIQRQSLLQNPASPFPKAAQSKPPSTLQPVRQPSKPRSTLSVSRVAPLRSHSAPSTPTTVQAKFSQSRPNSATLIQADADAPFVTISRSGGGSEPSADYAEALELLAQEIYSLLRQRLAIEQERRGAGYPNRFR